MGNPTSDRPGEGPGGAVAKAAAVEPADGAAVDGAHAILVVAGAGSRRYGEQVVEWAGAALERGERVVCRHAPDPAAAAQLRRWLAHGGIGAEQVGPVGSGRAVELLDAGSLRAHTGGRRPGLLEVYLEQVVRAERDGFTGVALTGDCASLYAATADLGELRGHERDLDRMCGRLPLRALCRFREHEPAPVLGEMLAVHHRTVLDEMWDAEVRGGVVWVRGELDLSNVARFAAVLRAATAADPAQAPASVVDGVPPDGVPPDGVPADGVAVIDVCEVGFCSATALTVLVEIADDLGARGSQLVLRDPASALARLLRLTGIEHHPHVTVKTTATAT